MMVGMPSGRQRVLPSTIGAPSLSAAALFFRRSAYAVAYGSFRSKGPPGGRGSSGFSPNQSSGYRSQVPVKSGVAGAATPGDSSLQPYIGASITPIAAIEANR